MVAEGDADGQTGDDPVTSAAMAARKKKLPVLGPLFAGEDLGPRPGTRAEVAKALGRGVDPVTVVEHVGAAVDKIAAEVGRLAEGEPTPACSAGCCHCCHQRVEVTVPEIARLARRIRHDPGLVVRVEKTARRVEGLAGSGRDGASYQAAQIPCAFLGSTGRCAVYDDRPLGCRRAHSVDVAACEAAHRDPTTPRTIPTAGSLAWNTSAIVVGMLEGMQHAGLPPDHYELHQALAIALAHEHELPLSALAPARTRAAAELTEILGSARR